eukprot:XP_011671857.1 PREDICTED: uncharacterized protein LOC105441917 [Strongylocentrotus purpuratus]
MRNGASSQGGSRGTDTNTSKSDTEGKTPDTRAKPQPPPCTYSPFDTRKGDDIRKNPFNVDCSWRTGVSSEGSSKGTQSTTYTKCNTDAKKSDIDPNLQRDRRSTMYSYSSADGSNRFGAPMKNTSKESFGSGVRKRQMPTRSAPGDGWSAKPAGDSKERTKGSGTKDGHVKSTEGTTTDELPNYTKKRRKETTATEESQSADALQYFGEAYPKRNCKGQAWVKHLEKQIQDCLHDIKTWIEPKNEDDQIVALTEYLEYLPSCGAKVEGYLYIATIYFKKGKEILKFDEYENCQGYLNDCRVPLGEAEMMCDHVDPIIRLDVTALKKNVEYHEGLVKRSIARAKDAQARQQRELAEAKEKKIALDQLKTDIKALDNLSKLSIELFVKQVYQSWPPKGTKETQPSLTSSTSSSSSQKKLLIRAISHYHPDKVDKNVHGIKWQLLSCEITKCLSKRFDIIK